MSDMKEIELLIPCDRLEAMRGQINLVRDILGDVLEVINRAGEAPDRGNNLALSIELSNDNPVARECVELVVRYLLA